MKFNLELFHSGMVYGTSLHDNPQEIRNDFRFLAMTFQR